MENDDTKPTLAEPAPQAMPKEVRDAIENLPESSKQVVTQFIVERTEAFSGPLPSPRILREYNEILPGAAERTFVMSEKEQTHRHEMDNKIVNGTQKQTTRGQWIGASLVIVLAAIAFVLGMTGHDWLAGAIFTTTIISVAIVFVLNRIPPKDGQA